MVLWITPQLAAGRPGGRQGRSSGWLLRSGVLLATLALPVAGALAAEEGGSPAGASPEPADAAAEAPFDVWEYRVEGNTLLPAKTLEAAVYPLLGPGKRLSDVDAARAALEQAYRDAGYPTVFVDIPEQQVDAGIVRLAVTEGRIASVKVTGARYVRNGWIREQVPEARAGAVPRIGQLQQELRTLGARSGDRIITPVLRPGRVPGTVDVELKVQDQLPVNGSIELNNRSVPNTTDTRVAASLRYDNLWQRDHSLGLQYQVAPEERDETEVIAASYSFRPKGSARSFAFYAVSSESDIAVPVGGLDIFGSGLIVGGRAILPLPGPEGLVQGLTLGVDYKDFDEAIRFGGDPEDPADIITPISYLNWSATWNASAFAEKRTQAFELGLNFGLRKAANEGDAPLGQTEFEARRFKARGNYVYLAAGYDLLQALPRNASAYVSVNAQITPQPLVPNEQFNAGGLDTVRGYFESEVLADYGLQLQSELRTPPLGDRGWSFLERLYGYTFLDWATLRLLDPLPNQLDSFTIYSAGVGMRLAADQFTAGLDWAWPFKDSSATEAGDSRLLFLMRMGF